MASIGHVVVGAWAARVAPLSAAGWRLAVVAVELLWFAPLARLDGLAAPAPDAA